MFNIALNEVFAILCRSVLKLYMSDNMNNNDGHFRDPINSTFQGHLFISHKDVNYAWYLRKMKYFDLF